MRRRSIRLVSIGALAATIALTACGDEGNTDGDAITVWTTDTLPDRVAATEAIIDDFTDETGIEVELVGVDEDNFQQVLTSAAAADDLPDVLGSLPLAAVRTLAGNELVDAEANRQVVDTLGEETFSSRTLELTREGDDQLAVPGDAWAQLLYYRKDLFEAAGLAPPETYGDILAAAEKLDSPELAGFTGATAAGDAFTQQTFEHLALANGCELVDDSGRVALDSPECVDAFAFYGDLVQNYSVSGAQDVDTVRAQYFAGESAMFIWSTLALDEMAGLRDDAMPSCPECADNPAFLAENTGIVTSLRGPDGDEPALFGEIQSWTVTVDAATEQSQQFVEFMLSDGYRDWLAIAPEGKFPARIGTQQDPSQFTEAWKTLPVGVDRQAPLSDFYPPEALDQLTSGPENMVRWGITQGQGDLIGATLGELPATQAVLDATSGQTDAQAAAEQAAEAVRSIQESLR